MSPAPPFVPIELPITSQPVRAVVVVRAEPLAAPPARPEPPARVEPLAPAEPPKSVQPPPQPIAAVAPRPVAPPPAKLQAAPAVVPAGIDRGEVLDFCRLAPEHNPHARGRQRLVMFDVAGEDVSVGPEQLADSKGKPSPNVAIYAMRNVHAHEHVSAAFLSAFPTPRFYNVFAKTPSPATLRRRPYVANLEMLESASDDPFAAYSIACADWVAMPRVISKRAVWKQDTEKRTVNDREVSVAIWKLDLVLELELDVYRHEYDGWVLADTVEASNGGLLGFAFGLAAQAKQGAGAPGRAAGEPPLLSQRPDPKCKIPGLDDFEEIQSGLSMCLEASLELSARAGDALDQGRWAANAQLPLLAANTPATERREDALAAAAALQAARTGHTVRAATGAAKLVDVQWPAVRNAFSAIQKTQRTCESAVDSVKRVADDLRGLAQVPSVSGALGFAACFGIPIEIDLGNAVAPGASELRSSFCTKVDASVDRGDDALMEVATCQSRVAMERATLALLKEARRLDGWRLRGVVRHYHDPVGGPRYRVAIGRLGAQRGDVFTAVVDEPTGPRRIGFGRIVKEPPEGGPTDFDFKWRSSAADSGTRLEEHPQIGVLLGLRPELSLYTSHGALDSGMSVGAVVEGGYNASKFVNFADEVWSRVRFSYAVGSSDESFFAFEITPDAVFYVLHNLGVFIQSGVSYARVSRPALPDVDGSPSVGGGTFGFVAGSGLDFAWDEDWTSRLGATYRLGFSDVVLENGLRAGSLSALLVGASLGYTF